MKTFGGFQRRFVRFLERATDVSSFTELATTERASAGVSHRLDYLRQSDPCDADWVVFQRAPDGEEVRWIVVTRKSDCLEDKDDDALHDWCRQARRVTAEEWRFTRINKIDFDAVEAQAETFGDLFAHCWMREARRLREELGIAPMTHEEIRAAIEEGRE